MRKLEQISEKTTVDVSVSSNLTRIEINVSLHPKDVDEIQDLVIDFLQEKCEPTKKHIKQFNEEYEFIKSAIRE